MKPFVLRLVGLTLFGLLLPLCAFAATTPGDRLVELEQAMRISLQSPDAANEYLGLLDQWKTIIEEFKSNPGNVRSEITAAEAELNQNLTEHRGADEFQRIIAKLNRMFKLRDESKLPDSEPLTSQINHPVADAAAPVLVDKVQTVSKSLAPFTGTYTFGNKGVATFTSDGYSLMLWYSSGPACPFSILLHDIGRTHTQPILTSRSIFRGENTATVGIEGNVLFKTDTVTLRAWRQVTELKVVKNGNILTFSSDIREYRRNFFTRQWYEKPKARRMYQMDFFQTSEIAITFDQFREAIKNQPTLYRYVGKGPLSAVNLGDAVRAGLFEPIPESAPGYCEEKLVTPVAESNSK